MNPSLHDAWMRTRGLVFPVLIITSVLVIVVPLPAVLMDLLLACNVTAAVLILLTTVYVSRPLDFSAFPAILLGATLVRLVLNVASTRLILTQGETAGTAAAGDVIQAFGQFVAGDRIVVGLIMFAIVLTIQFLVITKGAGRISEVSARFFLDGLPGRQMSIDSELSSGLITQDEAKQRRAELESQADFYGAMDGASKFVRGDGIAGLVITFINILGGFYVGVIEGGLSVGRAAEVFTKLTIGDGLVTQVPGFLIALAAGLIVTRSSAKSDLPGDVVGQVFRHPEAMFLAAAFLVSVSFTGLPAGPLLALAAGCAAVGFVLFKSGRPVESDAHEDQVSDDQNGDSVPRPEDRLGVDLLSIELGGGVLAVADPSSGGDLLERIEQVRHRIAEEYGIILPRVRVRDHAWLGMNEYVVRLRDVEIGRGEIWPTHQLAVNRGGAKGTLPGIQAREPVRNDPAVWIEPQQREQAQARGYAVFDSGSVISNHMTHLVTIHAGELLTRQHVHELIGSLKDRSRQLVEELEIAEVTVSTVHQVLCRLLNEQVPVRDLETILQTLIDHYEGGAGIDDLTNRVRAALAPVICQRLRDYRGRLHVLTIDPSFEQRLQSSSDEHVGTTVRSPDVVALISREVSHLTELGLPPVVLTSLAGVRSHLKRITARSIPQLIVLSIDEVSADTQLVDRGQIGSSGARQPATSVSEFTGRR